MNDLFDNVAAIFIALYNVLTIYFILYYFYIISILPYQYNYLLCCIHCF